MKRLLLTFCLLLIAGTTTMTAQITITEDDMRARIQEGMFALQYSIDIYLPSDPPADSVRLADDVQAVVEQVGAGGTYDLTDFAFESFASSVGEIRPLPVDSDVPGASTFNDTDAEYVTISQNPLTGGLTYTYVGLQSDGLYEYGTATEGAEPEVNDPPSLQQPLPLAMGTSWTNVDTTEFFGVTTIDSSHNEVVGYGQLLTPSGAAPTLVMRQHSLSITPGGGFVEPDTTSTEMYIFFTRNLWLSASLMPASEESPPAVFYTAESNAAQTAGVESGETGTIFEGFGALVEFTDGSTSDGTLQAFRYDATPLDNTFSGSATSGDGTTIAPTVVADGGYLVVEAEGLNGFTYRLCLDYGSRSDIADPGKLVLLKRDDAGADWTPLNTTLDEGAQQVCASGLTSFSQFAVGSNDAGIGTPIEDAPAPQQQFALHGNTPNPFGEATTIRYVLPEPSDVRLNVYDVLGRRVTTLADGRRAAGEHAVRFDASTLPAGIYVYRLTAGNHTATRQMVHVE